MIKGILSLILNALILLVLIHAIGSWIPSIRESRFYAFLDRIVSPLLEPIRSVIKPINGLDLSPAILLILLYLLKSLLRV